MPVPKPSNLARWAETAGGAAAANITEPASGQKDTGWTNAQVPPSSYFNWWMHQIYKWILWADDLANQAFTWTAAHTFNAAVTFASTITAAAYAFSGSNAATATAQTNSLSKKNVPKAWASVVNLGTGATPTAVDGFNVASVAFPGSNFGVRLTWGAAMANANYAVVASTNFSYVAYVNAKTTGHADILIYDPATNALVDLTANPVGIEIIVFGAQ